MFGFTFIVTFGIVLRFLQLGSALTRVVEGAELLAVVGLLVELVELVTGDVAEAPKFGQGKAILQLDIAMRPNIAIDKIFNNAIQIECGFKIQTVYNIVFLT